MRQIRKAYFPKKFLDAEKYCKHCGLDLKRINEICEKHELQIPDIICNPETRSDNNHYDECATCRAVTTDEKVRLICVLFVKHYMKQRNRFHITEDLETKIKEIIEN